ncbi:acyl carrier protein [Nocardia ignorata]|uniref:Phosphopantetheine binding protein n=1 Tax=Nocardia ignorata TaxID=145285 RepID=A0A4R6PLN9_NOCIG|nr:acyl carrier protein [Nocardia ignorata]TDP37669.1 phosphopantetheine binding protein [Nocardia ignorata]
MSEADIKQVIADELGARGYQIGPDEFAADLISVGVNSVNLVRVLTTLEEQYNIEFEPTGFFREPVTVVRLAQKIIGLLAQSASA